MPQVTMRQMLEAGVHFGHQKRFWNPRMAPFIFGDRNKIHIINLEKTVPLFQDAINFVGSVAQRGGTVLFVGTKRSAGEVIKEEARRCGMPYVDHRWLGGMLTNYRTIRQSIKRLKELVAQEAEGHFERLTKKEASNLRLEMEKLERSLGGIQDMDGMPQAMFVIDVGNEKIAISEANRLRIPVIGVVDTNNNPDGIEYVIPGNDDAQRAIKLYASAVADAVLEARGSNVNLHGNRDEFVEIDDKGQVESAMKKKAVAKKAAPAAPAAKKKASPGKKAPARKARGGDGE